MKNYLILHYGFEKPTPEEMGAWKKWFESIADRQVDRGGLRDGREISHSGSLDEAEELARECPIVASTRVYEIAG